MVRVVFFLMFLGVAVTAYPGCSPCQAPGPLEDIDWERMNQPGKAWYAAVNMPIAYTHVNCFNWVRFIPNGNGTVAVLNAWAEGGKENGIRAKLDLIRVEGKPGYYKMELSNSFHRRTSKLISHKGEEEQDDLSTFVDKVSNPEFYFITDYEHYLIIASCTEGKGTFGGIKTRTSSPSVEDLILAWNKMNELGICAEYYLNEQCINRYK